MVKILGSIFRRDRIAGLNIKKPDVLIALLATFQQYGKKQVSLSEFLVAIESLQQKYSLDYTFSKFFLYSYQLFEDIKNLEQEGEVFELQYRHDAFLPKSFLELSATGLVSGQQILAGLSAEYRAVLEDVVTKAVEHYHCTWRLWSRSTTPKQPVPNKP